MLTNVFFSLSWKNKRKNSRTCPKVRKLIGLLRIQLTFLLQERFVVKQTLFVNKRTSLLSLAYLECSLILLVKEAMTEPIITSEGC